MENDPSTASLLQFFTTLLTLVILRLWQSCVRMFLFLALMNLLVPISKGMLRHLKSFPWIVVVSSLYISAFLDVAASMLADVFQCTMSSTSLTSWLLVDDDQARLLWRHSHVVNENVFFCILYFCSLPLIKWISLSSAVERASQLFSWTPAQQSIISNISNFSTISNISSLMFLPVQRKALAWSACTQFVPQFVPLLHNLII